MQDVCEGGLCREQARKQDWAEGKAGLWCSYYIASLGQACSEAGMTFPSFLVLGQWDCPLYPCSYQPLEIGCSSGKRI